MESRGFWFLLFFSGFLLSVSTQLKGCDASILIDSTKEKQSEKDAGPNQTVREFELIDEAKAAVEAQCPLVVSCADIITLATRDAVALAGGPKYVVPTGRRDGLISNINEVNLPGPQFSVSQALQSFTQKNFNLNEMVTLLGAHTVGVSHCSFFQDRLFNFQGTGQPDSSMDPILVAKLSKICSSETSSGNDPTVFLNQNTSFIFYNQFYKQIVLKRGILQIDQELAEDQSSKDIVLGFTSNDDTFKQSFANAMVKLSNIDVLVNNVGEIRKNCRVFNEATKPSIPPPKVQQVKPPLASPTKPPPSAPPIRPPSTTPSFMTQPSTLHVKPTPSTRLTKPPTLTPQTPPTQPSVLTPLTKLKPLVLPSKPPPSPKFIKSKPSKPKSEKKLSKPFDKNKPFTTQPSAPHTKPKLPTKPTKQPTSTLSTKPPQSFKFIKPKPWKPKSEKKPLKPKGEKKPSKPKSSKH